MFEQPLPGDLVRRAAMVSQSPSMIRQWIENTTSPRGGEPRWQIFPHPTRAARPDHGRAMARPR